MYLNLLIISFVSVSLYHLYQYVTLLLHRRTLVKKHACKPPPAYPQKDPLFGLDMCRDAINAIRSKTYLDRARRMYEQNGNTFSKYILGSPSIHTVEPENIKAILTNLKDFGITSGRKMAFLPLVGRRSILLSEGSHWETSRAFLRPVFVKGQVGDLVRLESHVAKLIRAIPRDGSTVDLGDLFFDLTANVTIDLMFGKPAKSAVKSSPADFAEAFHHVQVGCEERWRRGKLANVLPHAEFYRSVKKVHEFVDEHVLRAVEFHKAGKAQPAYGEKEERYILLQELGKLTDDVNLLRDELTTIFLAGRDTTASLLCNVFFMVARRPDIWRRVRNEVTPLDGKLPTLEQINQMSYIRFCINESLRLHPPVPYNARAALRDTILPVGGGSDGLSPVLVPKGTEVAWDIAALHRRRDLWGDNAADFRPERWEDEKMSWKYLPFSGGPRVCIGQQLALTEASYTIIRIAQELEGIESRDPQPWTESIGVVCTIANGVKVSVVPC